MHIRETEFWKELEGLFAGGSTLLPPSAKASYSTKFCNDPIFKDRFRQALHRAKRSNGCVLLWLLQIQFSDREQRHRDVFGSKVFDLAACRIGSCLRSSDSIYHMGEGRVAVLLEDVWDSTFVPLVIEKVHSTLVHPFKLEKSSAFARPCSGASLYPDDGLQCEELWNKAEQALEVALQSGSGSFRLSPGACGHTVMERFELSKDLYRAYRNSEFRLDYQPIYSADGARAVAVEALLRWQSADRGVLYPAMFLSLLEETGLIVPLGEQMLSRACRVARGLGGRGRTPVRICVNVSGRQLADSGFLLSVLDALYESELDPGFLQLEFSESALADELESAQRVLPELRTIGVRVTVDHFGVGEFPLTELVRLPVDMIKIDRSLTGGLDGDPVSQAIISGAFALADGAGMEVAAVGVEEKRHLDSLAEMGCEEVQGCHLSCPLTERELMPRLRISLP